MFRIALAVFTLVLAPAYACADDTATPGPTALGPVARPTLQPGLTLHWNWDKGKAVERLVAVGVTDADCPAAPCSQWDGTYPNGHVTLFRDVDGNTYKRIGESGKTIPGVFLRYLKFPLTVGAAWSNDFINAANLEFTQNVKVVGWQKIQIAAGSFNAVHLHGETQRAQATRSSFAVANTYLSDYYYVPELGVIAKYDSFGFPEIHHELTQFENGK